MRKIFVLVVFMALSLMIFSQINLLNSEKELFSIKNLKMNTDQQDFGAVFYKNKIVFASTNANAKFISRTWTENGLPFLDLYVADIEDDAELSHIKNFSNKVNRKFNEGPATFTEDGNFMVFTANNYSPEHPDDTVKLKLYRSKFENGKWTEDVEMPFNSDDYSVAHASLSPDGKMLFFASDMPGGYGGVDIYVSYRKKGNKWTKPQNLGNKINTAGDDMFPFYHTDGLLFFASDGHKGFGGLDIFVVDISDVNNPTEPKNLGQPVNSEADDFTFVLDKEQKKGYFASNRMSGKGNDDIYSFELLEPIILKHTINGVVVNEANDTVQNVQVYLYDTDNELISSYDASKGLFSFDVENTGKYFLTAQKNTFENDTVSVDISAQLRDTNITLVLKHKLSVKIICRVIDAETKKPIDSVLVQVSENQQFANGDGVVIFKEENKKLNENIVLNFSFSKSGYNTGNYVFDEVIGSKTEFEFIYEMQKTAQLATTKDLEPVYFEFDRFDITPQIAERLDDVVDFMNKNPQIKIEVRSYADCRGSDKYNKRLSQRRADATVKYIRKKIDNPKRISGKGFGETNLFFDCNCNDEQNQCTEEQYRLNRRTEFVIVK